MRKSLLLPLLVAALALAPCPAARAAQTWHVQGGDVTLSFDDSLLATFGLQVIF